MKKFIEKLKYLLPLIGSFLGTLAGQGFKFLRRVILPIILAIVGVFSLNTWLGIFLGTFGIWVSMGYGIPDPYGIVQRDEGSTLGSFWWHIFNYNHHLADIFTRGTIGLGMCLTGLLIPLIQSNWLPYAIGCFLIMIGQTVFSYRGWGFIPFFGKELLWSDLINYFLIFLGYLIMLI